MIINGKISDGHRSQAGEIRQSGRGEANLKMLVPP